MLESGMLLKANAISKRFAGHTVLENVDFHVPAHKIVTLIGPNGSGKTTLLKILLGLIGPDSGTLVKKPGLRIGYVPQKFHVDPVLPMNVETFLRLSATAHM